MTDFTVNPTALHRISEDLTGLVDQIRGSNAVLTDTSPANPDFRVGDELSRVKVKLSDDRQAISDHVADVASRLDATATAYERVEADNEANAETLQPTEPEMVP